jgi:hypothetical protein
MPAVAKQSALKRNSRSIALRRAVPAHPVAVLPGSFYERARHLIGTISGPGDLSTNPRYMDGYGQSRRP